MLATMTRYERQSFAPFMHAMDWRQGEHVLIAAPTQCGKTTLSSYLATKRDYVVVLASKTRDANLRARYRGYRRCTEWPPPRETNRVLLWPKGGDTLTDIVGIQRDVFKKCLDSVGRQGGWCVVIDEAHWASQFLKLDKEIAVLHHQGSSSGISMMTLTQRPAWIPRIIYSSASHAFIGQTASRDDMKALATLGGADEKTVRETISGIGRHDLMYINPMGTADTRIINTRK